MTELSPTAIKRLRQAIEFSRRKLRPFRENRHKALREYVGKNYGDSGSQSRVYLNLIDLAMSIYVRQLVAQNPQALVTTRFPTLKRDSYEIEIALNHSIQEMDLAQSLQDCAVEAMLSVGVLKIGLNSDGIMEDNDSRFEVGSIFASTVGFDDLVFDMSAFSWGSVSFIGDRYRLPYDLVMDMPGVDRKVRDQIKPTSKNVLDNEDRDSDLSGDRRDPDEIEDHVDLWDIYLPRSRQVLTFCGDFAGDHLYMPLKVVNWEGPENGPYHRLSFMDLPGNVMPLPPVAGWYDLHRLTNVLFGKLANQAQRQKNIGLVRAGGEQDATNVINANDGDVIKSDDPQRFQEVNFGGIDSNNMAFMIHAFDRFKELAGNLDMLGGLSPQADTAMQDQLIAQNASKRIAAMQDRMNEFVRGVVKSIAWHLYYDPLIELPLAKRIEGTDIEVPFTYTNEDREGDFLDFNFTIEPYSMHHHSPGSRMQMLDSMMEKAMAMMPFMQPQGMSIDMAKYFKLMAKYSSMPEIGELIVSQEPDPELAEPIGQPPAKASHTKRTYERVNRPGATSDGKDQVLMNALIGANSQPAQKDILTRNVG